MVRSAVIQLGAVLLLVAVQYAAASHWGDFKKSDCVGPGLRKWYSRLWDIQGDWNDVCQHKEAWVGNQYFAKPSVCVNKGAGGMWGEFWVSDWDCNYLWSAPHKTENCSSSKPGFGKFVAKLEVAEDVSSVFNLRGKSVAWSSLNLCRSKEATIEGVHFSRPDQCVFKGAEGIFGEFFIRDFNCDVDEAVFKEMV